MKGNLIHISLSAKERHQNQNQNQVGSRIHARFILGSNLVPQEYYFVSSVLRSLNFTCNIYNQFICLQSFSVYLVVHSVASRWRLV